MKNILYIIIISLTLLIGCGDNDESSPLSPVEPLTVSSAQGKIENYKKGDYIYLLFYDYVLASAPVGPDGSFNIQFPDASIYQFDKVIIPAECSISDPEAKIAPGYLKLQDGVELQGGVYSLSDSNAFRALEFQSYQDQYWFADREVTIKGHYEYAMAPTINVYIYDIHLYRGWNRVRIRISQKTSSKIVFQHESASPNAPSKYYSIL